MSQIKLINFSGRTIRLGEPVMLHATKPNSFDYAPLGSFGIIGHAAEQITFGSWGLINLLGSGSSVIGTGDTTITTIEQITTSVVEALTPAQIMALIELFSTTDTTKGAVPGSNNAGANYYLNAKRGWTVPSGRPQDRINFISTATPQITNYNATWAAIHTQHPRVSLYWIDIDPDSLTYLRRKESMQRPDYIEVNGLLDTIIYDMGGELLTGYIILE